MPTNLPDADSYPDLTFPEAGLDLSAEFEQQAPGTTPVGTNVRAYEPLSGRDRGGSRQGLSRYVSTTVAGTHVIQHLNVIVDPTPAGLPAYQNDPYDAPTTGSVDLGGGLVPDPTEGLPPPIPPTATTTDPSTNPTDGPARNNGNRTPRTGGTGDQPNRNLPPPAPPPPPIAFVQSVYGPVPGTYTPGFSDFGFVSGSARRTVTTGSHVADGHLLVAFVTTTSNPLANIQVRNGALSAYTQAGSTISYSHFGQVISLSAWFRIATGGTLEDTLHVDPDVSCAISMAVLEFKNVLAPVGASLDAVGTKTVTSLGTNPYTTDSVAVNLAGDLLVAAFTDDGNDPAVESGYLAGSGFTVAVNQYDGTDMSALWVEYKLGLTLAQAATLDVTATGGQRFNALGATFKQA